MNGKPVAGQEGQDGLFASSVFDKTTGEVIVKVVNTSDKPQPLSIQLNGMKGVHTAQIITLSHDGMTAWMMKTASITPRRSSP